MQALLAIAILLYPVLVYLALDRARPRWVALGVLIVFLARLLLPARTRLAEALGDLRWAGLAILALCVISAAADSRRLLLFMPAAVSFFLLGVFAASLRTTPIIERFARLQVDSLSSTEQRYCRSVTVIWSAFFLLNGTAALALALWGVIEVWALYTGLLSYLLIGTLFTAELLVRKWRFRRYEDTLLDTMFRRLFPPRIP